MAHRIPAPRGKRHERKSAPFQRHTAVCANELPLAQLAKGFRTSATAPPIDDCSQVIVFRTTSTRTNLGQEQLPSPSNRRRFATTSRAERSGHHRPNPSNPQTRHNIVLSGVRSTWSSTTRPRLTPSDSFQTINQPQRTPRGSLFHYETMCEVLP